eukprot:3487408-Prymnesium_polylepis.1
MDIVRTPRPQLAAVRTAHALEVSRLQASQGIARGELQAALSRQEAARAEVRRSAASRTCALLRRFICPSH